MHSFSRSYSFLSRRSPQQTNNRDNKNVRVMKRKYSINESSLSPSRLSDNVIISSASCSYWRDDIQMKYCFSDILTVKEEVELLLKKVREVLTQGLHTAQLPWDVESDLTATEHNGRVNAIMAHLHLNVDGTPIPLTWWQWLRHGSVVRHIEWKIGVIRQRQRKVLASVRDAVTAEDKDAVLVKHFILELLPPFERYAVGIYKALVIRRFIFIISI